MMEGDVGDESRGEKEVAVEMEGVEADESRMVARGIGSEGQVVSGRKEEHEVLKGVLVITMRWREAETISP